MTISILHKKTLEPILRKTELIESTFFSQEYGNRVFLKPENFQVTGSFKIRGTYYKISKLCEEEKSRGGGKSSLRGQSCTECRLCRPNAWSESHDRDAGDYADHQS